MHVVSSRICEGERLVGTGAHSCGALSIHRLIYRYHRFFESAFVVNKKQEGSLLSPGCQAVRCCQVICRAVGQLPGTVRCLCQTTAVSCCHSAVGCCRVRV